MTPLFLSETGSSRSLMLSSRSALIRGIASSGGTEVRGMRLEVRKPGSLRSSRSYQTLDPKPQIRLVVISLVLSPLTSGLYQEPGREASERATALCIYYLSSIFSMTSRAGSVRRPRASLSSVTLFCKVLCCTLGLTFSVLLAICSRMCCSLSGTFICSSLF